MVIVCFCRRLCSVGRLILCGRGRFRLFSCVVEYNSIFKCILVVWFMAKGKGVERKLKDVEFKFNEPSLDNVELGDFLVCASGGEIYVAPITETSQSRLWGSCFESNYTDAVILKRDGKYFVGSGVSRDK